MHRPMVQDNSNAHTRYIPPWTPIRMPLPPYMLVTHGQHQCCPVCQPAQSAFLHRPKVKVQQWHPPESMQCMQTKYKTLVDSLTTTGTVSWGDFMQSPVHNTHIKYNPHTRWVHQISDTPGGQALPATNIKGAQHSIRRTALWHWNSGPFPGNKNLDAMLLAPAIPLQYH
jgi:hypothetical protein